MPHIGKRQVVASVVVGYTGNSELCVLVLSFKLGNLTEDLDGLSNASRARFETSTGIYSFLMTLALLGGVLLFVLMAPFELRRISRKVNLPPRTRNPQPQMLSRAVLDLTVALSDRRNSRLPKSAGSSVRSQGYPTARPSIKTPTQNMQHATQRCSFTSPCMAFRE